MLERIQNEPALVMGLLQATVALAVGFGLDITPEQVAAVLAFSAAALSLVTRSNVTPLPRVQGDDL